MWYASLRRTWPKRLGSELGQPYVPWRASRGRVLLLIAALAVLSLFGLATQLATLSLVSFPEPRPALRLPTTPRHQIGPPKTVSPRAWTPRPMGGRWIIRGHSYDLREFVEKHPGGRRYLENTVDTDITELFESMHVGTTAASVLQASGTHSGRR